MWLITKETSKEFHGEPSGKQEKSWWLVTGRVISGKIDIL